MDLNVNDGTRPSKLELSRYATGELSPDEASALEARLDEDGRAWLSEIDDAAASLPRFDAAALRARAGQAVSEAPPAPVPANNRAFYGVFLLLAAAVLGFVLVGAPGVDETSPTVDPDYIGVRGSRTALEVHVWEGGALAPWSGRAVGEGDRLGFQVDATGHDGVVLLSVDGDGQVSVYWPASGDAPEPLPRDGVVKLPGSLTLDGARGPEVFLAVFDRTPAEARDVAQRTWQSGGHEGLVAWSAASDHVDAVVMERR